MNDQLFALFSKDNTGGTPGEIVHLPEGIEWEEERECGDSQNVEEHPADHIPFATEDKDQGLEAVNGGQHDQRPQRNDLVRHRNEVYQVNDLTGCQKQIYKNGEPPT
jgi:hypothetical protein